MMRHLAPHSSMCTLTEAVLPPVEKVLEYFKLLGRAMAKALQDNRLLDIPLSYVFYRHAESSPCCLLTAPTVSCLTLLELRTACPADQISEYQVATAGVHLRPACN